MFYQKKDTYYKCKVCKGVYADEGNKPNLEAEKERYELHDDDSDNQGYRNFVAPIISAIADNFRENDKGLDFGAGTSAIIATILKEQHYNIKNYDPFFHVYPQLLEEKYDYISSCEVIEHFYNPYKEFKLLKNLLKENAKLYLMTELYSEEINFSSWYYKNDSTHVFFYSHETFEWIKKEFGFSNISINKRLIILEN